MVPWDGAKSGPAGPEDRGLEYIELLAPALHSLQAQPCPRQDEGYLYLVDFDLAVKLVDMSVCRS